MTASKTLFVGDLEAQHKVFKRDIEPVLSSVNAVVQLGNMISCTEDAIDKKEYGRNFAVLEMWQRSEHPNLIKLAGPNEIAAINTPEKENGLPLAGPPPLKPLPRRCNKSINTPCIKATLSC